MKERDDWHMKVGMDKGMISSSYNVDIYLTNI